MRHIEVHQLWLQEKVNAGEIEVMKVKGEGNFADALTKPLDGPGITKHLSLTKQEVISGRHDLTPDFETAESRHNVADPEDEDSPVEYVTSQLVSELSQVGAGEDLLDLLCFAEDTGIT